MSHIVKDIRGELCYACMAKCNGDESKAGKAKIVHFVLKSGVDRFFFGCDKSTEHEKCGGTPQWNRIQVPEELKEDVLREKGIFRVVIEKKKNKKNKRNQNDEDSGGDSGGDVVVMKKEKIVSRTTTKRTVKTKTKRVKDDDDYDPQIIIY